MTLAKVSVPVGFNGAVEQVNLSTEDRPAVVKVARGTLAECYPLDQAVTAWTVATGVVQVNAIGLKAGDVVSNIQVAMDTISVGTVPTSIVMGLANKAGIMVALTGETKASALWTTASGVLNFALTTPYTVPSEDVYYAVFLSVGAWGTTANTLASKTQALVNKVLNTAGGGTAPFIIWSAQTVLPAVGSALTMTTVAVTNQVWLGVS